MQAPAVNALGTCRLQQRVALPRSSSSSSAARPLAVRCSAAAAGGSPAPPLPGLVRLTAAAAGVVNAGVAAMRAATARAAAQIAEEDVNAQIREGVRQMRVLALVAPLAAVSGGADTFLIVTRAVASFIKLYLLLLFVRVLLSWFPTFQWWEQQPFAALRQVRARAPARRRPPPAACMRMHACWLPCHALRRRCSHARAVRGSSRLACLRRRLLPLFPYCSVPPLHRSPTRT